MLALAFILELMLELVFGLKFGFVRLVVTVGVMVDINVWLGLM